MASSINDRNCGSAPFALDNESSSELNDYLNKENQYAERPWIRLREIAICSRIPDALDCYLLKEPDFLAEIFKGRAFAATYDSCLDTILQCDPMPQVIMMPKISVYGNRMFLCQVDSAWYNFLLPFCGLFDGDTLRDVFVRAIETLPPHILDRIKVKAQGFFDINFVKVDGERLIASLFGHIESIMNSSFFTTAALSTKAFGILLQLTSVLNNPTTINVASLLFNLLVSCSVSFALIQKAITY
jgi:hypothetical protein